MHYKQVINQINQLFQKYGLHYEMREVRDKAYGTICKIYYIPFEGRAKAVSSGMGPAPCLEYFVYHFEGTDSAKVQALFYEFRNSY